MDDERMELHVAAENGDVDELIQVNEHLLKENDLLKAFLNRFPDKSAMIDEQMRYGEQEKFDRMYSTNPESCDDFLDMNAKVCIAAYESQNVVYDIEKLQKESANTVTQLHALGLMTELRTKDIKRQLFTFTRDVLKQRNFNNSDSSMKSLTGTTNKISGTITNAMTGGVIEEYSLPDKISSQEMSNYMGELLKNVETNLSKVIDKITGLKKDLMKAGVSSAEIAELIDETDENGNLINQKGNETTQKPLQRDVSIKKALNIPRAVDYDHLKIDNRRYIEQVSQKNKELMRLKLSSSNTVQALSLLKNNLRAKLTERQWLETELTLRREQTIKVSEQLAIVRQQLNKGKEELKTVMRKEIALADGPQPLDYLSLCSIDAELNKGLVEWERKVAVAEGRLKVLKAQKTKLKRLI